MKKASLISLLLVCFLSATAQDTTSEKVAPSFALTELTHALVINKLALSKKSNESDDRALLIRRPSMAHTAFFCRMEDKVEQSGRLPLKIRLGDVSYANTLEGKNIHDLNAYNTRKKE